ncbi:MAG: bifunctional DNA primase/polymerase, partial [Acidobacteriota bacterium]|nr:bifunctional DNA primase/polymerase [Acidobacteriota bacterium]
MQQLEVARAYLNRSWMPLPVPFRSKNPGFEGWQNFTVAEDDLPRHFNGQPQNIGVLLGKASGNLVDIDLDCAEAVASAPSFLPTTNAIFGRKTNPRSHWLYVVPIPSKVTFTDPVAGQRLIEILTNGQQAIFPGSTHKDTGELVQWYEEGEPTHVPEADLLQAARRLAAATLLARHWPQEGSRQDSALALAGGLLRAGWSEDETAAFIEAVCDAASDEETDSRIKTVCYTLDKLESGEHVTGWPTLAKLMDGRVVSSVREWLGLRDDAAKEQGGESVAQIAWPELHPAALHGLAGDFVHLVEPHSEADPVALLAQFLIAFGNMVGRTAHFITEADKHYSNIFAVLVGGTGTGRKGTSWGHVKRIFESLDEAWARDCIAGGMSSGEGLIYSVRDAVISQKPIKAGGQSTGIDEFVVTDKGVTDKRLLVFEGEFASVLRAQGREGNTLSMVIRNLWDTGNARSMVKNAPTRTTGAHVSIIGHITRDELRSCLDAVESVNGYVNRFLWVCTRRSKFLPRGGRLSMGNFAPIIRRLRESLEYARTVAEMSFDEAAGDMWDAAYIGLETGRTGLLGKVTQRASPYVLRLSCLY